MEVTNEMIEAVEAVRRKVAVSREHARMILTAALAVAPGAEVAPPPQSHLAGGTGPDLDAVSLRATELIFGVMVQHSIRLYRGVNNHLIELLESERTQLQAGWQLIIRDALTRVVTDYEAPVSESDIEVIRRLLAQPLVTWSYAKNLTARAAAANDLLIALKLAKEHAELEGEVLAIVDAAIDKAEGSNT